MSRVFTEKNSSWLQTSFSPKYANKGSIIAVCFDLIVMRRTQIMFGFKFGFFEVLIGSKFSFGGETLCSGGSKFGFFED